MTSPRDAALAAAREARQQRYASRLRKPTVDAAAEQERNLALSAALAIGGEHLQAAISTELLCRSGASPEFVAEFMSVARIDRFVTEDGELNDDLVDRVAASFVPEQPA